MLVKFLLLVSSRPRTSAEETYYILDELEQNIVNCQWPAERLFALAFATRKQICMQNFELFWQCSINPIQTFEARADFERL